MDATFGSRRGAVLQQDPESAHRLKLKVPLSRKEIGVGLVDTIDGVRTVGGMSKKNIFPFFFGLNSCPNTIKHIDATFGSRRGAVLQQNFESAHHPKIKVSLTRYELAVGRDPIDGVHTLAGTWRKNRKIFFFFCMTWTSNTMKQLDVTFGSRRGAVLQQNSESALLPEMKVALTRYQLSVGLDPINGVHTLAGMSKKNIFPLFLV